jgi:hypothetical protein
VSRPVFPQGNSNVAADDGDSLNFCSTCAFSQACLAQGMNKGDLLQLHVLVEHVGPFHPATTCFRKGDPFDAIAPCARAPSRPISSTATDMNEYSASTARGSNRARRDRRRALSVAMRLRSTRLRSAASHSPGWPNWRRGCLDSSSSYSGC